MIVHTRREIERLLGRRLVPHTDNRSALVELGFTPAYPHLARDAYYGGLWTRAIELAGGRDDQRGMHKRRLIMERAFHVSTERRMPRMALRGVGACTALWPRRRTYSPSLARQFVVHIPVQRVKHAAITER